MSLADYFRQPLAPGEVWAFVGVFVLMVALAAAWGLLNSEAYVKKYGRWWS